MYVSKNIVKTKIASINTVSIRLMSYHIMKEFYRPKFNQPQKESNSNIN